LLVDSGRQHLHQAVQDNENEREEPKMTKQPELVPKTIQTAMDDIRIKNPHPRTIHDVRLRDALVTHARSTR
jgi:hypothetical protein